MDQLQSALKAAHAGDVIKVAAGNYGDLALSGLNLSGVKITSLDAGHPATFNTISVTNSSGITFDHVSVKFTPDANTVAWSNAVYIYQSSHIGFTNSTLTGGPAVNGVPITATTLDSTQNVLGLPTGRGIFVFHSSDVNISNNDISSFHKGVFMGYADGITITDNEIHNLRTTPVSGGNVDNVTIAGNYLHDSTPWNFSAAGDHGDFIHLWTNPTQGDASQNIHIDNNFIAQGDGYPMLGIYLDDDGNNLGFVGVEISGNVVQNNNNQAIRLENVDGEVAGNTLVRTSATATTATPWLSALDTSNIVAHDNIYSKIVVDATSAAVQTDNTITTNGVIGTNTFSYDQIKTDGEAYIAGLTSTTISAISTSSLTSTTTSATSSTSLEPTAIVRNGTDAGEVLNDRALYSILTGFGGDDQYVLDNVNSKVVEGLNGGTDTVSASFNYILGANLENLTLRGTALSGTGNDLDNQIQGNALDNMLNGAGGNDMIFGGDGNDAIYGGDGNDRLHGQAGNDTLDGGLGDDWLAGYDGADKLLGGIGNDELRGGAGNDVLTGGTGADKFVMDKDDFKVAGTIDWITDFSPVEGDKVSLSAIDANTSTTVDDKFTFIGTNAFTGHAGELRYQIVGSDTYIYGDTNGDSIADVSIGLKGMIVLNGGDFIL